MGNGGWEMKDKGARRSHGPWDGGGQGGLAMALPGGLIHPVPRFVHLLIGVGLLLGLGCAKRQSPREAQARKVVQMEHAYRAAHALAGPRVAAIPVPESDYVKLSAEELIKRTRQHASKFVSDPKRLPADELPADAREDFKALYELCLREEILRAGTSLWRAVAIAQPDACAMSHEGYYDDFAGGALCVLKNEKGYRILAQAGRAGWRDLYAEARGEGEGRMVDGRIQGVMRTPGARGVVSMELALADGVAQLKLQGYDMKTVVLPGVYVRTATITPEGLRMLSAGADSSPVHLGAFRGTAEMHALHRKFLAKGCARFGPPVDRLRPDAAAEKARELVRMLAAE